MAGSLRKICLVCWSIRSSTLTHASVDLRILESGGRASDAIVQNFVAYKDSGGRTVNYSEFVGSYGAGFMSDHGIRPVNGGSATRWCGVRSARV